MIWFISVLLLVWCSWRVGSRLSPRPAERFWIGMATALLQLGTIAELTSVVRELRPAGWIVGQILIAMVILLGTGDWRSLKLQHGRGRWTCAVPERRMVTASLSAWGLAMLMICVATCALSAVTQIATPIHIGDEVRYHASRVIYWMQHLSVFPYDTHNDRQTVTPFGSELLFLWPVLLTKTEVTGRFVFWLAYPFAAIGQYLLLRAMTLSRAIALAGVVVLLETPLVATSAIGLKPELWSVVTLLGVAYWVVSICLDQERRAMKCFFLGTFTMLGVNMRGFPVALLPGVILAVVWSRSLTAPGRGMKALAGGLACGGLLSGLIIPVGFNLARYGHPLGPAAARHVVMADLSPRQIYTHAIRFAFLLMEPPDVAISAGPQARVEQLADRMMARLGAGTPLKLEDDGEPWPGRFTYSLGPAQRFSTWGVFWIPALVLALGAFARNLLSTWPRVRLAPIPALSLLAVPLLLSVLFVTRWMAQSDVPGRYLIGPYALTLPLGIGLFASLGGRRLTDALAAIVLVSSIYQPVHLQISSAVKSMVAPVSEPDIDGPFEEALRAIPGGSRILLVGQQGAPDYALFAPTKRYANSVIPWGKTTFDPDRMRELIAANHVSHVLVENDTRLRFVWDPDVDTREMVAWLGGEPWLQEISLNAPHMRLFATGGRPGINAQAVQTTMVPSSAPLITVGQSLQHEVGIEAPSLKTPWPVESLGGAEGGFLWIGQGDGEGVEFALWSRQNRTVDLQFTVSPGPDLAPPERTVVLLADGELVGAEQTFRGETVVTFALALRAGRNALHFFALDAATMKSLPAGDAKHLIVGLHGVRVTSGPVQTRASAPTRDDLSRSARRAAAVIARRQYPPGYWLTTYTSGVTFEHPGQEMNAFTSAYPSGVMFGHPGQEMNTFTSAIVAEILRPVAAASGLEGSVNAARQFLTSQIEDGGLVRYHGQPNGPTIGALGCVITPDADDTALVWRIAPGTRAELRSRALATLNQYRTADGLYRTWLAPREQYQCIDPGADPDPADAVIQMHVLMMLAEADPPAAVALCGALGHAIDQDRVWVYYRQAPLLPVLRQTDLRAAGCNLRLPPSRTGGAAAGQELWMAAAGLLSRVLGAGGPLPASAEVQAVLRQLAMDDFALVQRAPPLLYHNDLTASVRRFYWSEEFGYALWLRLWFESERHGLAPR